jgi:hypothetical protein
VFKCPGSAVLCFADPRRRAIRKNDIKKEVKIEKEKEGQKERNRKDVNEEEEGKEAGNNETKESRTTKPLAGYWEHGNERSDPIGGEECLDQLSDFKFLKKFSPP